MSTRGYRGNLRAPELPDDLEWVNTKRPLRLRDLRGRVVLLDFWTYGCINCLHILPDLRRLEHEFGDDLVIIGVHSAKFDNEKATASLEQVVTRYGIDHPVVGDPDYRVWDAYAVRAWPTTVVIDPIGRIVSVHSGEGVYEAHHDAIAATIEKHRAAGTLVREGDLPARERAVPEGALAFPGAVLVDGAREQLWIADSGHHRLLLASLQGEVQRVVGQGEQGFVDGDLTEARFALPLGMTLGDDGLLYVADSANHAVRVVDLAEGRVSTLAGDGSQARAPMAEGSLPGRLSSPWDLCQIDETLYIAMAGTHQLWAIDLARRELRHHAGSGREGILGAPLRLASMAQPSALASDGERLYVADAESSAVRAVSLDPGGEVRTIIGEGLFAFGDRDGSWPQARLQHPQGLAWCPGHGLFVADTYNHKIKLVDPQRSHVTTYAGDGSPGADDGAPARFWEPAGLACAANTLYVADANNHAIRIVDLADGSVRTLPVRWPASPKAAPRPGVREETMGPLAVRQGQVRIQVDIEPPAGYRINEEAPSRLDWQLRSGSLRPQHGTVDLAKSGARPWIEVVLAAGTTVLEADLIVYLCQGEETLCTVDRAHFTVTLEASTSATQAELLVPVALRAE